MFFRNTRTTKQRLQRQKNRLYTVDRGPFILKSGSVARFSGIEGWLTDLENVQADGTSSNVYVRMIAGGVELDGWSNIRVVGREINRNFENKTSINLGGSSVFMSGEWRLRAHSFRRPLNSSNPFEQISVVLGECRLYIAMRQNSQAAE